VYTRTGATGVSTTAARGDLEDVTTALFGYTAVPLGCEAVVAAARSDAPLLALVAALAVAVQNGDTLAFFATVSTTAVTVVCLGQGTTTTTGFFSNILAAAVSTHRFIVLHDRAGRCRVARQACVEGRLVGGEWG
jgi:hypothetical protein